MTPSSRILTVGSMAFDTVQTPAGHADRALGGSANYFSVAASFFAPVEIIAVVGDDFPKDHLGWLNGRSIGTQGVQIRPGKTFHWSGRYDQNLNEAKTLATELNVFADFKPALHMEAQNSPYLFLANIDPVLQLEVLDQMKPPRLVAADSMNFWIQSKKSDLIKTLARVDLLSINEGEAFMLTGEKNLLLAADQIRAIGPRVLVVKRGEYGAMAFTPTGVFAIPAFPVRSVIDPTGAGDSFAGAMIGTLAREGISKDDSVARPAAFDQAVRRAIFNGCVMASFTVQDFSLNRLKALDHAQFEERARDFKRTLSI